MPCQPAASKAMPGASRQAERTIAQRLAAESMLKEGAEIVETPRLNSTSVVQTKDTASRVACVDGEQFVRVWVQAIVSLGKGRPESCKSA